MSTKKTPEVLILGSGIAGLVAALKFAQDSHVTIVAKTDPLEGSTRYAQGGIASVWAEDDTFSDHMEDTLKAGAGLCHEDVAKFCVEEGPARIQELIDWGVPFSRAGGTGAYDLNREGGHNHRRILHAEDQTGLAIVKALLEQVQAHPNITLLKNSVAIDLILRDRFCIGAYVLDNATGKITSRRGDVTLLATGGAGKVYLYTSNPDVATGDGLAMAMRAGARVANLEFMQFHPTCLYHPKARTFLITEAIRGEGAELVLKNGRAFMKDWHPQGALAPRDVVARAIDAEIKRSGDTHVFLDTSKISRTTLQEKFPNIVEKCKSFGIDILKEPIPVVPAAHYLCGGVVTDHWGRTTIPGLYAVGEVACTGFHGANRLASNSLLEAVVFAHRAFEMGRTELFGEIFEGRTPVNMPENLPEWDVGRAVQVEDKIDIAATWLEIRTLMWNFVGIVRSEERLQRAEKRLYLIKDEIQRYYWNYILDRDLIELRNLWDVAYGIVRCAQWRKESRGLHFNVDYPGRDDASYAKDSLL